jgi:hemolysin activation/secretion protein
VIQPAFATDPNERLNEHQVPTPPILPAHPLDPFQLPPVKPEQGPEPAATGGSIMVDKITFTGNLLMPSEDLAAIAAPYLHRSLTGSDIDSLRQKLTQHYVDLGYINSGALLDANAYSVSDHSLHYTLVEGRLTAIRIKGLGRLNAQYQQSARTIPDCARRSPHRPDECRRDARRRIGRGQSRSQRRARAGLSAHHQLQQLPAALDWR